MPFGRGWHAREREDTVAESLVDSSNTRKRTVARAIGRVSTIFGEDGGQPDRGRAREVLNEPLCR